MGPWEGIGSKEESLSHYWSPRKLMPLPVLLPVVSVRMSSRRLTPVEGAWMKPMPRNVVGV